MLCYVMLCYVKEMVAASPVLSYYNPLLPLEVQCDASHKGLGAALMQSGKPIAYTVEHLQLLNNVMRSWKSRC